MRRCHDGLGDAFTLRLAPSDVTLVFISDPDSVKRLLTAPADLAPSGAANSPVAPIMGPSSVVVLTGPEHLRQRRLLLPPFHGERMREYEDVIVQETRRDMAQWPIGRPTAVQERSRRITLEVILRAVFGVEAERMDALRSAIGDLLKPLSGIGLLLATFGGRMRGRPTGRTGEALARLDEVILSEITARRQAPDLAERGDILSMLLLSRDDDGEGMTDLELRDELVTLLLAGHETTATSVAWAIERLVRSPARLARLIAEVDEGSSDDYMNAVVNETLRVRPVVPLVVRVLAEPMRLAGHDLPAGTRVVPSIYLTNRSPLVYDHPDEFRPERFLSDPPETFSWIPFGGGIRRCIGASFAQLEMKLILRTILEELEPAPPGGLRGLLRRRGELTRRRAITLVPSAGAEVIWRRR